MLNIEFGSEIGMYTVTHQVMSLFATFGPGLISGVVTEFHAYLDRVIDVFILSVMSEIIT